LSNRFTSKNPSTPQGKRGRLRKKEGKDGTTINEYEKKRTYRIEFNAKEK
jgi:hypothetical protein